MRNPMLRAIFTKEGQQYFLQEPTAKDIEVINLEKFNSEKIQLELKKYRDTISNKKRNVFEGDVAGLTVFLLPDNKMRLTFDIDLLVADILSISIIIKEISRLYNGKDPGNVEDITFEEYIENLEIDNRSIRESKAFWNKKIKNLNIKPIQLPILKNPRDVHKIKVKRHTRKLNKERWEGIKVQAEAHHTTPSIVLLTCYMIILEKWSNQENFYVNVPLFNRKHINKQANNIIADFTNLLLVEHIPKPNEKFVETLERVKQTFIQNVAHSDYSGVNVQRDISKQHGTQLNVAPVVFACNIDYELEDDETINTLGNMTYMISQTPGVWLDFQSYIKQDELLICWDKVDALFNDDIITKMLDDYCFLLESLRESASWDNISNVFLQSKEQFEIQSTLPNKKLYDGFLKNVKNHPEKVALIDSGSNNEVSYKELFQKSMALAQTLKDNGVKKGDYIGIILPRGLHQVVSILGILFAGAVYVPIGINQPNARKRKIYNQVGIDVLITYHQYVNKYNFDQNYQTIIDIDTISKETLNEIVDISADDSAYVIMTSGSTGIPKGVEISHNNVMNTILDINEKYGITSGDCLMMVSSIEFDLSVYDIFGILSSGGTVVLISNNNYKDPHQWLNIIKQYHVTLWDSVPILFDMLVTYAEGKKEMLPLEKVFLSGDWIDLQLPKRFYSISRRQSIVIAMGGATEASIWSNFIEVPRDLPDDWISIPYGTALKGQLYKVVDKFGRTCPENVIGELHIGGYGVAKGYIGDTTLTNDKFYIDQNRIRWYKTGDNGRIWNDGTIEFLGRKDPQVKIKGHRIEIGEIEATITEVDGVDKVKVIEVNERLSAFIIPKKNKVNKQQIELSDNTTSYLSKMDKTLYEVLLKIFKKANALSEGYFTSLKDILNRLKVNKKYEAVVTKWLDRLVKEKYVIQKDNMFKCIFFNDNLSTKLDKADPLMSYIENLESFIPKLIADELNPIELFYSRGNHLSPTYLATLMPWHNKIIQSITEKLRNFKKDNLNILEFETRNLEVSEAIYQSVANRVSHYDYLDTSYISKAIYKDKDKGFHFKTTYNQIKSMQYDVIILINALHRSYDVNQTIAQLKPKLKEGGQFIIVEPNISLFIEELTVDILNAYIGDN